MEDAMKSYLNPHDRFATRMKASMKGSNKGSQAEEGGNAEALRRRTYDGVEFRFARALRHH